MSLDFSRCRLPPFKHQREDVEFVLNHEYAFIASEMRTGKTKIVIDAAQFMFEAGVIDTVIVAAPAPVRDVWYDPTLGELAKHLWLDLPAQIIEYHNPVRMWRHGPKSGSPLKWVVTNFEFLRKSKQVKGAWTGRVAELLSYCGEKTLLVGDESSFLKNYSANQTEAFAGLREYCARVILINGTPIFHSPMDLFSQGNILHPSILNCPYVTQFKSRYAVMMPVRSIGGKPLLDRWNKPIMKVEMWTNLADLQHRFAACTIRRLQKDCLDLPPKLDPVTLTAVLDESWPAYKEMREDMVVWLASGNVGTAGTAAIRSMRLSQITSGILGGVEEQRTEAYDEINDLVSAMRADPGWTLEDLDDAKRAAREMGRQGRVASDVLLDVPFPDQMAMREWAEPVRKAQQTIFVGDEKLKVLLWFIEQRLEADPNLHLVAWSRFRPEVDRALAAVKEKFPQFTTSALYAQSKQDRLRALALLKPETTPKGPTFLVGVEGTGSFGIDMCAAHTCVTLSSGYSPGKSKQTLDRLYGPGQTEPIAYYDVVAVGPKGQKTIDHDIITMRRSGENVADRTAAAWIKALED